MKLEVGAGHDTSNNAWRPTDSGRPAMTQVIMHGVRQTVVVPGLGLGLDSGRPAMTQVIMHGV